MPFIDLQSIAKTLEKKRKYHIVFLGDSITSCEWVHPNWREIVIYILHKELFKIASDWHDVSWGIRGFNAGFDGATTKDMLMKLDEYVLNPNPSLVICLASRNDETFKIPLDEHQKNIHDIVTQITASGSQVVVCNSPVSLDYINEPGYGNYAKVASTAFPLPNSFFINLYEKFQQFDLAKMYTFVSEGNDITGEKPGDIDPDHPNQLGNAYIAKVILKEVFGIEFNPEKYIESTLKGAKYPTY